MSARGAARQLGLPVLTVLLATLTAGAPVGVASAGNQSSANRSATTQSGTAVQPTDPAGLSARVDGLQGQVEAAAEQLAAGAIEHEQATARLALVTQQKTAAERALAALRDDSAHTRRHIDALARSAFKGQVPAELSVLLAGDPRLMADLEHLRRSAARAGGSQSSALAAVEVQRADHERLVQEQDRLRREALAEKQALEQRTVELVSQADELSAQLATTAADLARAEAVERARERERARAAEQAAAQAAAEAEAQAAQAQAQAAQAAQAQAAQARAAQDQGAARAATEQAPPATAPGATQPAAAGRPAPLALTDAGATGPACSVPRTTGLANGFLAGSDLCPLELGGGHQLRTDAAKAFDSLNRLRMTQTGTPLCVTDSYRSYAAQVDVFKRKPTLAAVPGRSQHGWGLAVDLGCGAQRFGTEMDRWLRANAGQFGWYHPSWADPGGSKPEPWHWEFAG